jgi:hypothetical protein
MKKGMILYVTEGKDDVPLHDFHDLARACVTPGISAVYVATSEDEIAYGWWHLITRGMHQVSCTAATYDAASRRFDLIGEPLRLCG